MKRPLSKRGMTVVELLVTLAVLGVVLVLTSSGIVSALRVQRTQEDATNAQAKMRRVVEVVTQELRGAVLGGISDYPVPTDSNSISFTLLSGDGGLLVENRPGQSWENSNNTYVYPTDEKVLREYVGSPALLINGDGQALLIPEITHNPGSNNRLNHNNCKISIPYTPNTRLYRVSSLGLSWDPETRTLFQVFPDEEPQEFAFNISEFEVGFQYASASDIGAVGPLQRDASGYPLLWYEDGGSRYDLSRLQLTMSTDAGRGEREFVSFVELTGLGNDEQPITSLEQCGGHGGGPGGPPGGGNPGNPGKGGGPPKGEDPAPPEPEDPSDPGDDDDEEDENCFRFLFWWICR